jgi:hypothetical protein
MSTARKVMRFHVQPRCVPPAAAARRLGITLSQFEAELPALRERGFPLPDAVTGNYDLEAIDRYIERRNPDLFGANAADEAVTDHNVIRGRLEAMRAAGRG